VRRLELVTDVAAELQAALADGDRTLNSDGDLQESGGDSSAPTSWQSRRMTFRRWPSLPLDWRAAVGFVLSAIEVMPAIRAGQLDEAESLVNICAKSGASAGDIDSEWWPGAQLVTIRWYQDRLAELLPMLQELVHSPALSPVDNSAVAALAVAAALGGDRRTAVSCLAALRGTDLAMLPPSSSWLVTMNGVVEAAYLLEDADLAAQAYDLLRPYAHLPMVGGL
jgi:hypothetical protein